MILTGGRSVVRDYDESAPIWISRVAVCITAQHNSQRLIDEAARYADTQNAELHILHVNKGTSIFNNEQTPILINRLFEYGSEKGGMVHLMCSEKVAETIGEFIEEYKISTVVLGEPPEISGKDKRGTESEFDRIEKVIKKHGTQIILVRR